LIKLNTIANNKLNLHLINNTIVRWLINPLQP